MDDIKLAYEPSDWPKLTLNERLGCSDGWSKEYSENYQTPQAIVVSFLLSKSLSKH